MANPNAKQRYIEIEEEEETMSILGKKPVSNGRGSTSAPNQSSSSSTTSRNVLRFVGICLVICLMYYFLIMEDTTLVEMEDQEDKPDGTASPLAALTATAAKQRTAPKDQVVSPTTITASFPKGFGKSPRSLSDTYIPRGKPISDVEKAKLAKKWGSWTFTDYRVTNLPRFPNNDVPRDQFPAGSWQTDPSYLEKFLGNSISYVEMALEAILGEYGRSKFDQPDKSFKDRAYMFDLTIFPERQSGWAKPSYDGKHPPGNAGYATQSTLDAIKKRLLHAVMTSSDFHVTLGGHSAAAGHGNHFLQSYTLQIQRILEPVLARLNVYHKSHNFAMGGLGTIQSAMGMQDLYGNDADILIWDSGMTEGDRPSRDYFTRIAMLRESGKVPVIWGEPDVGYYDAKYQTGSIVTGQWGASMKDMPVTENEVQVETLPYAVRYLECAKDAQDLCKNIRYNATCWIEREDGLQPGTSQLNSPGGQAKWHPGNRVHQLQGRAIAFIILEQLLTGLKEWHNAPEYALPDDAWHLTPDYERIRAGIKNETDTPCRELSLPSRACEIPLYARSEFTPRYQPAMTSIRQIIKDGVKIPETEPNLYDPPEPFNPRFYDPEVDILSILENGVEFVPNPARKAAAIKNALPTAFSPKKITSKLEPGQGWSLSTLSNPDTCDGTMDSFCRRAANENCLLSGHNDNRGSLIFDSLSGWMILNLEKLKHGLIMVRMEYWLGANANPATKDWQCVNGSTDCKEPDNRQRRLGGDDHNKFLCDTFAFEYAIDGKKTILDRDAFDKNRHQVQRVVSVWYLLDDPDYTNGQERDVEVAIRMTGCGRGTTFSLSHVYWA